MATRKRANTTAGDSPYYVGRGSGITARKEPVYTLGTPDGDAALAAGAYDFDGAVAPVEQWALDTWGAWRSINNAPPAEDTAADYANRILHAIAAVRRERVHPQRAARWALEVGRLGEQARMKFGWEKPALHGLKMAKGRKVGTVGPIRKAVTKHLRTGNLSTAALWAAIAAKPPRGYECRDNRNGKYIDGPAGYNLNYASFAILCSKARAARRREQI